MAGHGPRPECAASSPWPGRHRPQGAPTPISDDIPLPFEPLAVARKKGPRCLRAASPAAPEATPAPPPDRMATEPSLEADRREVPGRVAGPTVSPRRVGEEAHSVTAERP